MPDNTPASIPQEIEVTLKLKILIDAQEARDYYLNADGTTSITVIADFLDLVCSTGDLIYYGQLNSVNDLTHDKIAVLLKENTGV